MAQPKERTKAVINSFVMHLDLNEVIQRAMYEGVYEPEQTEWAASILKPGSYFVDIGANFGHYVSLASKIVGSSGKVFAFEPSPLAGDSLCELINENKITNVELIRAAVGDREGEIELYLPVNDVVYSPSVFISDPGFIPHRVPMMALDNFAPFQEDSHTIDLIKIDVEGFEPNVIEGMKGLIRRGAIRNVMCEFNSGWLRHNSGITPQALRDLILELGFSVRDQTKKIIGLERGGERTFELQDVLFYWPSNRTEPS